MTWSGLISHLFIFVAPIQGAPGSTVFGSIKNSMWLHSRPAGADPGTGVPPGPALGPFYFHSNIFPLNKRYIDVQRTSFSNVLPPDITSATVLGTDILKLLNKHVVKQRAALGTTLDCKYSFNTV